MVEGKRRMDIVGRNDTRSIKFRGWKKEEGGEEERRRVYSRGDERREY